MKKSTAPIRATAVPHAAKHPLPNRDASMSVLANRTVRDAQRIAGALIASVPTHTDPFWREAPRQILVGALLHGKYCRQWGSLPKVYQLFTVGGRKAIEEMARAPHDPDLRFGWTDPKGRASATHPAVAAAAENILEMSPQTPAGPARPAQSRGSRRQAATPRRR